MQLELAAYLTHCNLQPAHLLLSLNLAMSLAFKIKNFINAASFARRLLELGASAGNAALMTKAKKVLQIAEGEARNAHRIEYDEKNPFVICCGSLTPIYKGAEVIRSAFCGAAYKPEFRVRCSASPACCALLVVFLMCAGGCLLQGKLCVIDGMSVVGLETLGLVCQVAPPSRR